MTMRQRLAHIALAIGCMAAGCDGAEVTPPGVGLITAQPAELLPSNSGVLLFFNNRMNIHTFLRESCAPAARSNRRTSFREILKRLMNSLLTPF